VYSTVSPVTSVTSWVTPAIGAATGSAADAAGPATTGCPAVATSVVAMSARIFCLSIVGSALSQKNNGLRLNVTRVKGRRRSFVHSKGVASSGIA
jgi:hypothetical protein